MSQKTLSQLRDADFAKRLKESLQRYRTMAVRPTSTQIIEDALAARPQRFYLDYRTIEGRINRLRRESFGGNGKKLSPCQQQWAEISAAINRFLARNKRATMSDAINHVVNYVRPSRFFISERKAQDLFRRTLCREYHFIK